MGTEEHARVEDETADALAAGLRKHYVAGKSIRNIALGTGYSITRVRSLLQRADSPLRSRGAMSGNATASREYSTVPLGFDLD